MSFASSWLKRLPRIAVRGSKSIRNFCPMIEHLEDRCTPSALPAGAIQISASPAAKLGYEFTATVNQPQPFNETLSALTRTSGGLYKSNGTYTFSLPPASSGNTYSMPTGLSLTSGGVISETSTMKPGQYNVPIQVKDVTTGGTYYDSTVYQFLISPQSSPGPTIPTWNISTTTQGLTPLGDLQYNNGQTLPLGIVDQPYNATVTATNPSDPITGVQISTYLQSSITGQPTITPVMNGSTLAGIYVKKSTSGNTYTYSIFGLDGTNGSALKVSWTSGSDNIFVTGTPTFSAAGQSYPLFLSVSFQQGPQHNFNFSFGHSPQEIESAYDFNNVGNGAGQTIVVIEYDRIPNLVSSNDPNWANSDLNQFDQIFPGLNTFGQPGGPVFLKVNGSGNSLYNTQFSAGDVTEEVQDIEWVHALAPMANIVDVNTTGSLYLSDPTSFLQNLVNQGLPTPTNALTTTIASGSNGVTLPLTAPNNDINVSSTAGFPSTGNLVIQTTTGTNVVQYNGLSATAFLGCTGGSGTLHTGDKVTLSPLYVVGTSGIVSLDSVTPIPGVTFVNSSGDDLGTLASKSSNVVLTGYTQLTQSPTSSYVSEAAVFGVYDPFRGSNGTGTTLGSGGSGVVSNAGPTPSPNNYQSGIYSQFTTPPTGRAAPDVSFNGSPESGDVEFNSAINSLTNDSKAPGGPNQDFGGGPREDAWGTSITSPSWDALFSIANQGRAALGKPSLSGTDQTLPMLYSLAGTSAFHQISTSTRGNLSPSTIPNQVATTVGPKKNVTTGGVYTSYGTGIYNTLAGLGSPNVSNLMPDLIGPVLNSSTRLLADTSTTLTLTGSDFVATSINAYSVTFSDPNVTATVIDVSPSTSPGASGTLTISLSGLSSVPSGTPLAAIVTMKVTFGSKTSPATYTDTTGAPVQVATIIPPLQQTVGTFNPSTATWYLRNSNSGGCARHHPLLLWRPRLVSRYRRLERRWRYHDRRRRSRHRNLVLAQQQQRRAPSYTPFQFGAPGWIPVVGDWDGTGYSGIGVFDPITGTWYLRNEIGAGAPDAGQFQFGGAGWLPVVGDWTGQGNDTIGVVNPATETWYLRNSNNGGAPSFTPFVFGGPGWLPISGDWNGIGHSGIGVVNTANATWYLRNEVGAGGADAGTFSYGGGGWNPVVGDWDYPVLPQLAAGGEAPVPSGAAPLTNGQLQLEVQAALNLLAADGVNKALLAQLGAVQFSVGPLPAGYLGLSDVQTGTVEISPNAAGYGWFVDSDPLDDPAFTNGIAQAGSAATNRMDLLTVVLHELGHFDGWTELDPLTSPDALMALTLGTGQRRTQDIDAVFGPK